MQKDYYLGIDIGGTKCAVIAGTDQMEIMDRVQFATEADKGPDYAIGKLLETAEAIIEKHSGKPIAIGISCGGPLNSKTGVVLSPPNLPGWDDIHIVEIFNKKFDVPVYLQNDANACALAEWRFGAGKGTDNMVFLTFGTGLGAGLILDGKLYSGTNDMAGEVGHIRLEEDGPFGFGKHGSFEGFCSGGGIAQLAHSMIREKLMLGGRVEFIEDGREVEKLTAKDLAEAANRGDETAIDVFKRSGTYLGIGLSIIIDIINPQRIVIGSVYARNPHLFNDACRAILEKEALRPALDVCEIVPAGLGDKVGDFASLSVAMM
jgi:glucokinase